MPTSHLLYLHGFRSSPQSAKARQVAAWVQDHHPEVVWWCPQLPPSPREALQMVADGIAGWPRDSMAVVGSSLGGFYATHVAETCACKAVLLNPAVNPVRDLAKYIGEQTAWHNPNEHFFFEPRFVDELRALEHGPVTRPEDLSAAGPTQGAGTPLGGGATHAVASVGAQYFAIIAKGDEVLDWREMTGRYPGARIKLLEGSDHALSDFAAHLPDMMAFLALA